MVARTLVLVLLLIGSDVGGQSPAEPSAVHTGARCDGNRGPPPLTDVGDIRLDQLVGA